MNQSFYAKFKAFSLKIWTLLYCDKERAATLSFSLKHIYFLSYYLCDFIFIQVVFKSYCDIFLNENSNIVRFAEIIKHNYYVFIK